MSSLKGITIVLTVIISLIITVEAIADEPFRAKPLARLFLTPNGRVLESMEVSLTLGGAFGAMNKGEYLGIASIGLGDVAELEVSTWRLVSNLFKGTTALGTTSLKVVAFRAGEESLLPDATITFRSNPSWASIEVSGDDLASDIGEEVDGVDFEMHMASLYLTISKHLFERVTLHAGVSLMDVRTRSGKALMSNIFFNIPDLQENIVSGFVGFERQVNPRTILMSEVSSVPRFNYRPLGNKLEVDQVALIIAGFRFYFTERISTDAGVKYRTDYDGIADAEISVGLNVGFNLKQVYDFVKR